MLTRLYIVKVIIIFFPLVMYRCESWTINKAECRRIDAFKLWCWRRLLKSPVDCKIKQVNPKGNQLWILIGSTGAEAEAPILWLCDAKSQFIGKDPDTGKDRRQKEKGWQRIRWLHSITDSILLMNWRSKLWEIAEDRGAWCAAVYGVEKSWIQFSDWTTTKTTTMVCVGNFSCYS